MAEPGQTEAPITISPDTYRVPMSVRVIKNNGGVPLLPTEQQVGRLETYPTAKDTQRQSIFTQSKSIFETLTPTQQSRLVNPQGEVGMEARVDGTSVTIGYNRKMVPPSDRAKLDEPFATISRVRSCELILKHASGDTPQELQVALADSPTYHHYHLKHGLATLYPDANRNPFNNSDTFTMLSGRIATVQIGSLTDDKPPPSITVAKLDAIEGENYDVHTKTSSGRLKIPEQYIPIVQALQNLGILTVSSDGRVIDLESPDLIIAATLSHSEAMRQLGYDSSQPTAHLSHRSPRTLRALLRWLHRPRS